MKASCSKNAQKYNSIVDLFSHLQVLPDLIGPQRGLLKHELSSHSFLYQECMSHWPYFALFGLIIKLLNVKNIYASFKTQEHLTLSGKVITRQRKDKGINMLIDILITSCVVIFLFLTLTPALIITLYIAGSFGMIHPFLILIKNSKALIHFAHGLHPSLSYRKALFGDISKIIPGDDISAQIKRKKLLRHRIQCFRSFFNFGVSIVLGIALFILLSSSPFSAVLIAMTIINLVALFPRIFFKKLSQKYKLEVIQLYRSGTLTLPEIISDTRKVQMDSKKMFLFGDNPKNIKQQLEPIELNRLGIHKLPKQTPENYAGKTGNTKKYLFWKNQWHLRQQLNQEVRINKIHHDIRNFQKNTLKTVHTKIPPVPFSQFQNKVQPLPPRKGHPASWILNRVSFLPAPPCSPSVSFTDYPFTPTSSMTTTNIIISII